MNFSHIREQLQRQAQSDKPTSYAVTKSDSEHRYTLGVLYVPNALDADDEFTDADELQKACWDYVRKGYRRIRDTHTDAEIGELVELISWPYEVTVDATTGDGSVRKYKLPSGTVFAGVIWDERVWPLVKSGKVRGYSLGGRAVRMKEASADPAMPRMAELLVTDEEAGVTKDSPIPNKPGKTNWIEQAGGLDPYVRKIAEDLVDKHGVSGAIRLAWGIVKRWCRGGGNVTAKTRAKACKAAANMEAKRVRAHAKKSVDFEWLLVDTITKAGDPTDDVLDAAEAELSPDTLSSLWDDE